MRSKVTRLQAGSFLLKSFKWCNREATAFTVSSQSLSGSWGQVLIQ